MHDIINVHSYNELYCNVKNTKWYISVIYYYILSCGEKASSRSFEFVDNEKAFPYIINMEIKNVLD